MDNSGANIETTTFVAFNPRHHSSAVWDCSFPDD